MYYNLRDGEQQQQQNEKQTKKIVDRDWREMFQ